VQSFYRNQLSRCGKLLKNILRLSKNNYIPTSHVVKNLRELWLHQIQNELPNVDIETLDNKDIQHIIMQVEDEMKGSFGNIKIDVSFEQLFDFFDEVAKGKVTEKTNKVQQWITYSNTSGI